MVCKMHNRIALPRQKPRQEPGPIAVSAKTMRPDNHRHRLQIMIYRMINFIGNNTIAAPRINKFTFFEQHLIRGIKNVVAHKALPLTTNN